MRINNVCLGRNTLQRRTNIPQSPPTQISTPENLFAALFQLPKVRSKYLDAPLLEERTKYLLHLLGQLVPRTRVRSTASMQLHAIKLLDMTEARRISVKEVRDAGKCWASESAQRKRSKHSTLICYQFTQVVTSWFAFSGLLITPELSKLPFDALVEPYLEHMHLKGYSEATIYNRGKLLSMFQEWFGQRHSNLAELSLDDIDEFLDSRRANGCKQTTLCNTCDELRMFIRYCESQNWCKTGIARGILTTPRATRSSTDPRGPAWKDVRRMLNVIATNPVELRENAIISLCAIYALRRSEIVQMRLGDLDWYNEIMTVRRAKRGGLQQFPIQPEVGEAILAYLKSGRPKTNCRSLFTTVRAPIRPMTLNSTRAIVAKRMKMLDIKSRSYGSHALRHSCATQLLNKGFSLPQIADFLGHRGLHSVSVYAKFSPRLLRSVASFSLAGIR